MMNALWSINERLGGNKGIDLDPPTSDFISDCLELARDEVERQNTPQKSVGVSDEFLKDYGNTWQ